MSTKKNILITGGTGLIGKQLTLALLAKGYRVCHLSRTEGKDPQVKTFLWDVDKGQIDEACLDGVDTIVHLAGAGIADKRWTDERKKLLVDSRTKTIGLIYSLMKKKPNQVKSVVSASATGYYSDRGDELLTEDSMPQHDFLGTCCIEWEKAVDEGQAFGLRILKYRTGVVLTKDGGALPQLALPAKFGVGSPIGTGKQWIPWIHHRDVVDMYLDGIESETMASVYNMVAPHPVTNTHMSHAVAKQLNRPFWAPNVPEFVIKLLLGEMGAVVLGSTRVSSQKIQDAGYSFAYSDIASALKEIYG
ncbi:TIGR01777 family oxidoreductase [Mucilaginibacter glaciei]|uniref:TIGR01777 family protein n=1 Tax=Mucilaginibacter glaciei TaxID=2772109 RepID=A0A926S0K9_9SPHI|nr:TIGR01777 family oxidoreductase [Mucilaginibacter glaciei]MBD1393070.1 TIGR01777 family protein [Mucilaginibacter glaciei]